MVVVALVALAVATGVVVVVVVKTILLLFMNCAGLYISGLIGNTCIEKINITY